MCGCGAMLCLPCSISYPCVCGTTQMQFMEPLAGSGLCARRRDEPALVMACPLPPPPLGSGTEAEEGDKEGRCWWQAIRQGTHGRPYTTAGAATKGSMA